jgi:S-DNA-T family DNA segregation ATPase FtsK/SpoIIIE
MLLHWALVIEADSLRSEAVASGDARQYMSLTRHSGERAKFRCGVLAGGLVALAIGVSLMVNYGAWWWWALAALVTVPLLAWRGQPEGRPIITPSMTTPRFRLLNADVVLRAYYAAGLGSPDKPGQQVTFGSPMSRDGDGSRVVVDLPYGKGLDEAVKARGAVASGLDVAVSQVFIHRDPTSHRRHVLWVADRDPLAVPVGRTPLLACKPADIWKPAPIGLDERGGLVTVPLMWNSVLVSALPRSGKTFSARLLVLYAALDPHVMLDVFDFKGSPDWRKFALVANSCAFGLTPTRDGLPLRIFGDTLMDIKTDVQDRYERLSQMDPKICPEGKLTREIARDPRYRMPVRLLVMDEFQEIYEAGKDSLEAAKLLTYLIKVAPGAGVILLGSTQRPSGVGGGGELGQQFTSFRDNFAVRFGLRTSSWQVSELCLGAGAYSEGLDTSTLLPEYKGVGILRGASDRSPTVRTYLADGRDAEKILTAARALRQQAGTLSGMAAGMETERDDRDVLGDVLAVFGNDTQLHWELLAGRLERQIPDRWADATGAAVSQQCRDLGVRSADVRWPPGRQGSVRKGCYKRDVEEAAARGTAGQED